MPSVAATAVLGIAARGEGVGGVVRNDVNFRFRNARLPGQFTHDLMQLGASAGVTSWAPYIFKTILSENQ